MKKDTNALSLEDKNILKTINKHGLSAIELQNLLKDKKPTKKFYNHSVIGKLKIGIISDTHCGSTYFNEKLFAWSGEVFRREKVRKVYHVGDITDGTSKREGTVYELTHIGFSKQVDYVASLIKKYYHGLSIAGILGNHDIYYLKQANSGANVGMSLQDKLGIEKFEYLGINNAIVKLGPKTTLYLHHPGDGSAYAFSYKMQKLVESLDSGNKPSIICSGHYHKSLYMFVRNVHCLESASFQAQTDFMRGKKLSSVQGFWILSMDIGVNGLLSFSPTFYPAYE